MTMTVSTVTSLDHHEIGPARHPPRIRGGLTLSASGIYKT
jgi:hypothetical protein